MIIVLTKKEFREFAIKALRAEYRNILTPADNEEIYIKEKYDDTVEISLIPKEDE